MTIRHILKELLEFTGMQIPVMVGLFILLIFAFTTIPFSHGPPPTTLQIYFWEPLLYILLAPIMIFPSVGLPLLEIPIKILLFFGYHYVFASIILYILNRVFTKLWTKILIVMGVVALLTALYVMNRLV